MTSPDANSTDTKPATPGDSAPPDEAISADPLALPPWDDDDPSADLLDARRRYESAWNAFRRGDFYATRREAQALQRTCSERRTAVAGDADSASEVAAWTEVHDRAQALDTRLKSDPVAIGLAAAAALFLILVILATAM